MQTPVAQWDQSGGNPAGSGFRAVNTVVPVKPASRYIELPSDAVASSPVIGPNGAIHVGTQSGTLYVCRPTRELPHRAPFERETRIAGLDFAVHTPAVAADGSVYCICTTAPNPRDHRNPPAPTNLVVAVNPDGTVRWTVEVPPQQGDFNWSTGLVRGAPRILSHGSTARVLFVVDYELAVRYPDVGGHGPMYARHLGILDETGAFRLFHRYEAERLFVEASGGGGFDFGATLGEAPEIPGPKLPEGTHPYRDTPVVFGAMPSSEPWTIVVAGRSGLYAFRWSYLDDSFVTEPGHFAPVSATTSPSAFANGLLAASSTNRVAMFETDGFTRYPPQATFVGQEAMAAGGLRQVYCLARGGMLTAVDSNGAVWKQRQLGADTVAFPVLSANHVHVVTMNELRTLTLDLVDVASVDLRSLSAFPGRSSPAIGPDGSIYLAIGSWLHCYFATDSDIDPRDPIVR